MAQVIFDEVVNTHYGQFDLVWADGMGFDGGVDRFFAGQLNGLAGAASGDGLYVHLGRRSGGSPVQILLHDSAPPVSDDWEDVVEVSISIPANASPRWSTWAGEQHGPLTIPPGNYRVRVNARGRDAGHANEFANGPVDSYLLDVWPAPAAPDAILRTTSGNAMYWHSEWGGRR